MRESGGPKVKFSNPLYQNALENLYNAGFQANSVHLSSGDGNPLYFK